MSQKFSNILVVCASLQRVYHVTKAVQAVIVLVVVSIEAVGALTRWSLLYYVVIWKPVRWIYNAV